MKHDAPDPSPPPPLASRQPDMTPAVLLQFLRWCFWGLVYLMTLCGGILAAVQIPVAQPFRLMIIAIVLYGIAVDVLHKQRMDTQRA